MNQDVHSQPQQHQWDDEAQKEADPRQVGQKRGCEDPDLINIRDPERHFPVPSEAEQRQIGAHGPPSCEDQIQCDG